MTMIASTLKRISLLKKVLFFTACSLFIQVKTYSFSDPKPISVDSLRYGKFGKLTMYHPNGTPNSLVLFVSGDGGWQSGVLSMARYLAYQGALVAGIDAKSFAASMAKDKGACSYPAADFEQLSMMLQRKYHFATYQKPILVGYSYGAVFIYGLIAQAPAGTFKGGISLGFCPDIDLKKPFCKGNGLLYHVLKEGKSYYFDRVEKLPAPFIVLNGVKDQTCPYDATASFLKGIKNVELITLPKVGHGFSYTGNWLPQFKQAYTKLSLNPAKVLPASLKTDLPIDVVEPKIATNKELLFFISGDGGWTSFDQGIANAFADKGVSVVGLDSQKYFWNARTPEETATKIAEIAQYYLQYKEIKSFHIMGYSFGACVAPFIANKLPESLREKLSGITLLSPDTKGDFEIHVADMLSLGGNNDPYDVLKEMELSHSLKRLCLFGSDEDTDITNSFRKTGAKVEILPGGHHFDNAYTNIVNKVLEN
ncbi:AcvB/VirJ family lysyl-phosphatidylglycerol hydrolase [Flectobacillus rivi]|uniref:AcvB/VirJ family lysyl-phosphatidylglycerol hydrolase n=1 Tax=Flectobacillus rivi TaxID=2984209 RepID=A0ABT6YW38_9BACT|nr:AcvB/VirJ family lysyl-phosphatidylglycerol hydrolase [Flectobacillus rivi]MDI9873023.1 AcvB/VirJ family lysyl-phosphatidylglycerol hydrolase [Flectobacillus rivi]